MPPPTLLDAVPADPSFTDAAAFTDPAAAYDALAARCRASGGRGAWHALGPSEEGRPLGGLTVGEGPLGVSLVAGHHADEPVGPETLRHLAAYLLSDAATDLRRRFRFALVPHANPDGAVRNRPWVAAWPDAGAYLRHVEREPPGRDLEFGFPSMRPENAAVSGFLADVFGEGAPPLALHASLHGMAFSEGALLLLSRSWTYRTAALQDGYRAAARAEGLRLHDHNRKGEKGFFYVGPGFTTTPRGDAMRAFFRAQGDEAMAARFHQSSMEFAQALGHASALGGDPLCLVTELPLFVVETPDAVIEDTEDTEGSEGVERAPGVPAAYLAFKARLPAIRAAVEAGTPFAEAAAPHVVRPLPLAAAMRVQLRALECALATVEAAAAALRDSQAP
jgi:hypothetical protein